MERISDAVGLHNEIVFNGRDNRRQFKSRTSVSHRFDRPGQSDSDRS